MEIRFGCPVCPNKFFVSLAEARNHVSEHKQAWKCGHCAMLFGSPQLALQHWKEAHPGIEGKLESIDTPSQINEKLYNGITLTRVQLNTKSLLNPPNLGEAQPKVAAGRLFTLLVFSDKLCVNDFLLRKSSREQRKARLDFESCIVAAPFGPHVRSGQEVDQRQSLP